MIVSVSGKLDTETAADFESSVAALISRGEKTLIIDFSGLEYISSLGLRAILTSAKRSDATQGKLVFAGLRGPVEEVFKISGFLAMFNTSPSVDDALAKI